MRYFTIALTIAMGSACAAEPESGIWKMNPARSTFAGDTKPKSFTVRIEPHTKGEVLTIDRVESNGQTTSSSTLLYLDGASRDFQAAGDFRDTTCSGTQSSRRVDGLTIEIFRRCGGEWIKVVRRLTPQGTELVLEITEQRTGGQHFERRLILEKK